MIVKRMLKDPEDPARLAEAVVVKVIEAVEPFYLYHTSRNRIHLNDPRRNFSPWRLANAIWIDHDRSNLLPGRRGRCRAPPPTDPDVPAFGHPVPYRTGSLKRSRIRA